MKKEVLDMTDTIVAISTAVGVGAISIIRLSGPDAIKIVNQIFKGKNLEKVPTHTIHYGNIIDGEEIIDEVLVSVMLSPKTFTTENVVEINCHGGIATTNKVLELVLRKGARLAEPGEFTKRAFLNGRIDLIKAESVMDLIESKTDKARKVAIAGISGKISDKIRTLRQSLVDLIANIEVNIDYPEYEDIEVVTKEKIASQVFQMKEFLKKIIRESETGRLLTEGIKTVIVGRPNVGKSSLLNRLLEEDKAIVTDIAGTTRDIVEGNLNFDGVLLHIIDTAGIRTTTDKVEQIGVEKSLNLMQDADLILVVLNAAEPLTVEDENILKKTNPQNTIVLLNKNDLESKIKTSDLSQYRVITTNTLSDEGIEPLKKEIKKLFQLDLLEQSDYTYLNNIRQISLAKDAYQSLLEVENNLNKEVPIDLLEIDLKNCWIALGDIIGENYSEELLDQLFSQFCVGK